jgi:hypothetical protein
MNTTEIVGLISSHKGQHIPVVWERKLKTIKNVTATVTKRTTAYVRTGINYANLGVVKEGIANGERGPVEPLPWGQWKQFPFVIVHTPKNSVETEYVRMYPAVFDNLTKNIRADYAINGVPATRDEAKRLCLASEFPVEKELVCFTVKANDIVSVGS